MACRLRASFNSGPAAPCHRGPVSSDVRPHRPMLFVAQFALAAVLIAVAVAVVLVYLLLLTQSYAGQGGLMPWVAAGVVMYGLFFVGVAAIPGVPAVLWSRHLAAKAPERWRRLARVPGQVGSSVLLAGFGAAVLALVGEEFRPKDPTNGCVSWRSAEASAAMAAGGPSGVDCPARK